MQIAKEEVIHRISVLDQVKSALLNKDALSLKDLSNQTIHCASSIQDSGSITIAVLVYALSKIIERDDYQKIKSWDIFVKKFNSFLDLAISALEKNNFEAQERHLLKARQTLELVAHNIHSYVAEVLRKAAINKGSKLYEHGLSLEQTAKLLGITQWELSEYTGQKDVAEVKYNKTLNTKERAKMALDFFS
jgi:hypothetical protein